MGGTYTPGATFYVTDRLGRQHNASGKSLFAAAAAALHWFEVDCQFRTARCLGDHEIPSLSVNADGREATYKVKLGRIRKWITESGYAKPWWNA